MINVLTDNIKVKKVKGKSQPIYEQIRRQIHGMVKSGEIQTGQELPSISFLSEKLDVNYRTVRSALDLLEKDGVLNCEPNKRPVVLGCSPDQKRVKQSLAFAFIRMTGDDFFVSTSAGIKKYTDENDIECLFIDAANDHDKFLDAIMHPGHNIDGLIFAPYESPEYDRAITSALKRNTSIVLLDRVPPNMNVSSVSADHFMGTYTATAHLLENHSRPVYFLGNTLEPSSCRERVSGWRSAMHAYNYPACNSYLFDFGFKDVEMAKWDLEYIEYEIDAALQFFFDSHDEKMFSILASNDYVAKSVCVAAQRRGFVVGKDIFIVGFGDLPMASRLDVPLTTVRQFNEKLGYEAARMLFETAAGLQPKPVHRILPVELVVRQSSIDAEIVN